MIDEIIKRVHNLTPEQQKDVLEHLKLIQTSDSKKHTPARKQR